MKPMTIEELKALKVGDWVWLIDKVGGLAHYRQKNHHDTTHCLFERCSNDMALNIFRWDTYGKAWSAYKNKEQAEYPSHLYQPIELMGDKEVVQWHVDSVIIRDGQIKAVDISCHDGEEIHFNQSWDTLGNCGFYFTEKEAWEELGGRE